MRKIFTQGRYATVASTAALVMALSGTAYALNTVDTFDIVNDTIQSVDVKNDTLSTVDIHDGTIVGADVQDNSIRTEDIANGSLEHEDFALGETVPARFAFVHGDTGQASPADAVLSSTHTGVGTYHLVFGGGNACASVATAGEHGGSLADPRSIVTVNQGTSGDYTVQTAVDGVLQDMSFNIGLFC